MVWQERFNREKCKKGEKIYAVYEQATGVPVNESDALRPITAGMPRAGEGQSAASKRRSFFYNARNFLERRGLI